MKVKEVMTEKVECCSAETRLSEVSRLMQQRNFGAVPITDEQGEMVGIVTDRDIAIAMGNNGGRPATEIKASEVMNRRVHTTHPEHEVEEALETMRVKKVSRLPVVDGKGKIKGILSVHDVVRRIPSIKDAPQQQYTKESVLRTIREIKEYSPVNARERGRVAA